MNCKKNIYIKRPFFSPPGSTTTADEGRKASELKKTSVQEEKGKKKKGEQRACIPGVLAGLYTVEFRSLPIGFLLFPLFFFFLSLYASLHPLYAIF